MRDEDEKFQPGTQSFQNRCIAGKHGPIKLKLKPEVMMRADVKQASRLRERSLGSHSHLGVESKV